MALRRTGGSILTDNFLLTDNPFAAIDIYNVDAKHTYVPEVFGNHLNEFYEKFFILSLENERHRQVIGAVWSSHGGERWGKGFGKSMLMAEESKQINHDLGMSMLLKMKVEENDITANPVLAGYCTFDQSKGITSFPAVLLDAVAFILRSSCGSWNVHKELRARILSTLGNTGGYDGEAIYKPLLKYLRSFGGLNIQLSHHTLIAFMNQLSGDDTDALVGFIRNEIGPRIKASQGFNFVHVFNAFARMAGIVYIAYFIDQIENFARFVRQIQQERDVKIIREAMCQTSPTADMCSFIFQMHVHAQQEIENWWQIEDLPSLTVDDPKNQARIVDIDGLEPKEAKILAERYLSEFRPEGKIPPTPLFPFSDEIIEAVRQASHGNPRDFLRKLGEILNNARVDMRKTIDLAYVEPLLGEEFSEEEKADDDSFDNPTR